MSKAIRVLLVDDHPVVRKGLAAVLDIEDDIKVIGEASDGLEGVRLTQLLKPDVVLIDLKMPELDGVGAIRKILAFDQSVKIIILTSYADDKHIYEGIAVGAKGYLLKDAPPDRLVEAVRAAYKGESLLSPEIAARILSQFSNMINQSPADAPPAKSFRQTTLDVPALTRREKEVLNLLGKGTRNREIANQLVIVETTVKIHLRNIYNKLNVGNRTEAVLVAKELGLLD
ncbi:MAG: response regulator transcription factor [Chloroflexota bacterium]